MGKNKKYAPPVDKVIESEVKEETATILDAPVEEKKEEEIPVVKGFVVDVDNCLNIRRAPIVNGDNIIGILGKGVELSVVDPENPVDEGGELWYKVLVNGDPGYAMKKYIKIVD